MFKHILALCIALTTMNVNCMEDDAALRKAISNLDADRVEVLLRDKKITQQQYNDYADLARKARGENLCEKTDQMAQTSGWSSVFTTLGSILYSGVWIATRKAFYQDYKGVADLFKTLPKKDLGPVYYGYKAASALWLSSLAFTAITTLMYKYYKYINHKDNKIFRALYGSLNKNN